MHALYFNVNYLLKNTNVSYCNVYYLATRYTFPVCTLSLNQLSLFFSTLIQKLFKKQDKHKNFVHNSRITNQHHD